MPAPPPAPVRAPAPAPTPTPVLAARAALMRQDRFLPLDFATLGFALASLLILLADRMLPLEQNEQPWLRALDYGAIAIFGLLLVGKTLASLNPVLYVRHHWFDVLGLLPITNPLFGLDRWWPLIGVLIVLARGSAALDRAFGERVLARVFQRYRAALVEELTEPILIRLLVVIRGALSQGRYMESIGQTLETKRPDLHAVVRKSIEASPKLTFLRRLPGVERKIDEAVDELVTSAVTALTSEEMNGIVADAITKAIGDLESELAKPQWKKQGLSFGDIARGFTHSSR